MKFVFLYGPPAVGKLTIATELQKVTGYKLFHNHLVLNIMRDVFGSEHPIRKRLGRQLRLMIFEEAAEANINLIATFGAAGPDYFTFFDQIIECVESHDSTVCLVQLTAPKETLLERVDKQSRKDHNKIVLKEKLQELFDKEGHLFDKYPTREHLGIDTTNIAPHEAAGRIKDYYKL